MRGKRAKALWAVAALLTVNAVLLAAQPGLALPGSLGSYFFAELADTTEADEQQAIDSKQIAANGIRYVGRSRRGEPGSRPALR